MWHEARKQEKKIREVMVDFQKRAERRREHYEKTKVDPSYYLQLRGIKCPLHLDSTGGKLNDTSMIPWQGNSDNMISRYDVRVHMDYIPEYSDHKSVEKPSKEEVQEENRCNYERYRSLVYHQFKGDNESDILGKLDAQDIFTEIQKRKSKDQKGHLSKSKAAIGFDYDDGVGVSGNSSIHEPPLQDDSTDDDDNDEFKMDYDVDDLSTKQIDKLNVLALEYGISRGIYSKSLRSEKSVLLERKDAKKMEQEKSALSGKKARKERRQYKDMMLKDRDYSPPLYMRRDSPTYEPYHREDSRSSSCSSGDDGNNDDKGTMEFITEFGADPINSPTANKGKVSSTKKYRRRQSPSPPPHYYSTSKRSNRSRSRSRSRERHHKHRDYHSSRDYSPRYRSRSRSHSPSKIAKHKLISKKATPATTVKEKKSKLTPQERLKKKMQAQLSKTFKEDKKAEKQKAFAKEAQEMEREEHLREETRKLKEREKFRL